MSELPALLTPEGQEDVERDSWPAPRIAWSMVALLMLAYFISYIDRTILSLLIEPIKTSLNISDLQFGLLQGAFGLCITALMFPAGLLVDKISRTRLISFGIAFWSIATALCGLAANFTQLFIARLGVAAGEATLQPAAPSLISDNFPPESRTLPLSLYSVAGACGVGASMIAGGSVSALVSSVDLVLFPFLGNLEPWQIIFILVGLPGLVVSMIFLLINEPVRRDRNEAQGSGSDLLVILRSRSPVLIPLVAGVSTFFIYAFAYIAWVPAYFIRVHGWSVSEVGFRFGTVQLIAALGGGWMCGFLAPALSRRGRCDANLLCAAILMVCAIGPGISATLVDDASIALALIGLMTAFSIGIGGPNIAAIQEIVPNRLRGRVTAIYFMAISLIGVTLGPVVIGFLNDFVFPGASGIASSLALAATLAIPLSSFLLFVAARARRRLVL